MKIKNLVKTLALTTALTAPFASQAEFLDFQVDETRYGGSVETADKHNGGYKEIIEFDDDGNFVATAFAGFGQLFSDNGSPDTGDKFQIGTNYLLYAIFTAEGTLNGPVQFGAEVKQAASRGSFSLYLDPESDTTVDTSEKTFNMIGTDEDILLGGSNNLGRNILTFIPDGGVFDFIFNEFELTEAGDQYYVSPQPFYTTVRVDGDFDTFDFGGTQEVTGDLSAVFIPEPSTLAVLGLGLLGLGANRRRNA